MGATNIGTNIERVTMIVNIKLVQSILSLFLRMIWLNELKGVSSLDKNYFIFKIYLYAKKI
jgi:hypothetical protein